MLNLRTIAIGFVPQTVVLLGMVYAMGGREALDLYLLPAMITAVACSVLFEVAGHLLNRRARNTHAPTEKHQS